MQGCCVAFLMMFGVAIGFAGRHLGAMLRIMRVLCKLGMCVQVASTMEQCPLFSAGSVGRRPMALMIRLDWVIQLLHLLQ
jgi:hypothetical protein